MENMKKHLGIILGFLVGVIDIIPMILQNLTWDANLSALSMWTVTGFFISKTSLKIHPILKGIVVALLVLLPCAFLIAWQNPTTFLFPILPINLFFGGLLGYLIDKFSKK